MKMSLHLPAFVLLVICSAGQAYLPPIGIPNPADHFGAFDPVDAVRPDTRIHCPGWYEATPRVNSRLAGDIRDAYYIHNSHPAATDSANTYGSPVRPRKTIPNKTYVAGDYIEIHGDRNPEALAAPYTGDLIPHGVGTDAAPIWFVGVDQPVLVGKLNLGSGSVGRIGYLVFEGIQWRNGGLVDIRPRNTGASIDHVVFRGCLLKGKQVPTDVTGFTIGSASTTYPDRTTSDILFYNGEVSHFGDKSAPGEECCFYVTTYCKRFWILDSRIHDAAEDGMQFCHGAERTSSDLFVGRNEIYDNLTDPIDIKGTGNHVVFSQNTIYGHHDVWVDSIHKSTGSGACPTFHYSGASSGSGAWKNYPEDITFIFNTVRDGRSGIGTSSCGRLRLLGNTFYNTRHQPSGYSDIPFALDIRGVKGTHWIAHNTIDDCQGGIRIWDASPPAYNPATTYFRSERVAYDNKTYMVKWTALPETGIVGKMPTDGDNWEEVRMAIHGNVISRTYGGAADIRFDGASFRSNSVDMGNNCVFNPAPGGAVVIGTKLAATDVNSDPLFSNQFPGDVSLVAGSPVIDKAVEGPVLSGYTDYQTRFGIDIRRDVRGAARPAKGGWDMGAHEFGGVVPGTGNGLDAPGGPRVEGPGIIDKTK